MKDQTVTTEKQMAGGFTIVELMVATMVFSVILLVVTVGVIKLTAAYYKGVNSSTTQNVTRNVIDTISQALQFSGGYFGAANLTATTGTYCIGNQQFDFVLGREQPNDVAHALYQSPSSPGACSPKAFTAGSSHDLLGSGNRLVKLQITTPNPGRPNLYAVAVKVAYGVTRGNTDLYCAPVSVSGSCSSSSQFTLAQLASPDLVCRSQIGSQFCVVTELSTTVLSRVK